MRYLASLNLRSEPLTKFLVWCFRVIVGATFVISGFVKAVDPWGTMYKLTEYLAVWGLDMVPRQAIFCFAIALAMVEFVSGAMLLLGCMRRSIPGVLAVFMAFMLPLTAYIYFADPVSDCGCFGDALILSNGATFLKNIVLTAMIVYLVYNNEKATYIYPPLEQWLVALACAVYALAISLVGVNIQPVVDYRPYPVGQPLVDDVEDVDMQVLYERDGVTQAFSVYDLPDSTWTYVGRQEGDVPAEGPHNRQFAILEGDEDVTFDVIADEGPQMLYVITNPLRHNRARASMANRINERITADGGTMVALVAGSDEQVERWRQNTNPAFDVYACDDTLLKELVRGDAALVYLVDGVVVWKRNLYSFTSSFPTDEQTFGDVYVVDDGHLVRQLTWGLLAVLGVLFVLGIPGWNLFGRKKPKGEAVGNVDKK